jgi:hypothetical protein
VHPHARRSINPAVRPSLAQKALAWLLPFTARTRIVAIQESGSVMRRVVLRRLVVAVALAGAAPAAHAVAQQVEPATRQAAIEQAQAEKVPTLHPFVPGKVERLVNRFEGSWFNQTESWHPFFESAYSGGGFAFGAGYLHHVSPFNSVDVRGSYTVSGYKRAEAEFVAPRLFHRRGELSVLGGWREATQVGFFGFGTETSKDDRTNFDFQQPYASAALTLRPTRRLLVLHGGVEWTRWTQRPGEGTFPSVETVFTPATLPGLGAKTTYIHSNGTVGFDWRTSPGYSRRGGYYGVTVHDYADRDDAFGFDQVNYEVIQHLPILRETWVISLRGLAQTAFGKSGQEIPFFLMPALGGGDSLRGFSSRRFRDRNSLLLQAEWRIPVSRFLDTAVFYDAGKVTARAKDLDLNGLKSDYGFGLRFHGPFFTPLRVEIARGNEGLALIFGSSAVF